MHKQNLLRAASAVALIAAMGTAAVSQTGGGGQPGSDGAPAQGQQRMPDGAGPGGASEQGTRPADRTQERTTPRSGTQDQQTPRASDRAQDKSSPKSRVQGQGATPKASDRAQDRASPKSPVGEGRSDDRRRSAGDRDKDGKDRQRQTRDRGTEGKDQQRQTGDRDRDRTKGMTDRGQRDGDRARQDRVGGDGDRQAGERVQLSQQQRTRVQERLVESGRANRVTNVNFDIRVGASVPRNVNLVALPPDIIEIVPEYRGYQYVYAGDSILIVDPNDYVVVAVLGSDSRVGQRRGRLTVSSEDRVYIREHVDLGAPIRLGIGGISIGMTLPPNVELRPLPATIWERVPDLREHQYFVYEDDIVVVDPDSREVVLVIED